MLRLDQWAVRSSEPVAAQTGEGLALLSTERNRYFVLNGSAAALWGFLERPTRLSALAEALAADFAIPFEDAADAVLEVIASLREQNVILISDGPT